MLITMVLTVLVEVKAYPDQSPLEVRLTYIIETHIQYIIVVHMLNTTYKYVYIIVIIIISK